LDQLTRNVDAERGRPLSRGLADQAGDPANPANEDI